MINRHECPTCGRTAYHCDGSRHDAPSGKTMTANEARAIILATFGPERTAAIYARAAA